MAIAALPQLIRCAAIMAALASWPAGAQPPASSSPRAALSAEVLEWETDFVVLTMQADMLESAASALAKRRASEPALRAFAAHMVVDHRDMRLRLTHAARALHLPVPVTLSGRAQARLKRLERTPSGEAFDDAYVDLMLRMHRETLAAHLAFAANPGRPSLLQASREARGRIQDHIDQLERLVISLQPPSLVQDTPPPTRTISPLPEDAWD